MLETLIPDLSTQKTLGIVNWLTLAKSSYQNWEGCHITFRPWIMHFSLIQWKEFPSVLHFFCLWIYNRCRTFPKNKMRVSNPWMVLDNRTGQFFFNFLSAISNIGWNISTAHKSKIFPNGGMLYIWTQGHKINLPGQAGKQRESYFHMSIPLA